MANIPLHFSCTVQDGLGVKRSTDVYLSPPDTTTLAAVVASIGTWLSDLDAATDGAITADQIRIIPALPGGLKSATGATWGRSRNMLPGVLRYSAAGTSHAWSSVVPALAAACIVAGKPDIHGATLGTYSTLLTTGSNGFTNANGQALAALESGIIGERKSRKQLGASSRAV
jgi:hypothetical protein